MKKKDEIIHFLYQLEDELPAELSELYDTFCSETGYEGTKGAFSQHLSNLEDSNLLKKPSHGKWDITDFGKNYCSPKEEQVSEKNDIVRCLTDYFSEEAYEEIARAIQDVEIFELSLSRLDVYQSEVVDFFESKPWLFREAVEESLDEVFIEEVDFKLVDFQETVRRCSLSELRKSSTLGEPVSAEVMVKQSAEVEAEIASAIFECSQCSQKYEVEQEDEHLKSPYKCDCGCRKFKEIEVNERNYLKLKLSSLRGGSDPITAVYRDKDIGETEQKQLRPGERIQVLGVPESKSSGKKEKTQRKIQFEILSFRSIDHKFVKEEVSEGEKAEVRRKVSELKSHPFWSFSRSLAPEIYGEEELKEVIAPTLLECPSPPNQETSEGKIHTLEVSNPGKGKSEILEFVAETFGDAHYGNGRNASGVGLTASVIKSENDEFDYSSGLLAKAHKGWAGIDDLDNLDRKGELPDIRQAMDKFTTEVRERTLQDIDTAVAELDKKHATVAEYFQKTEYEDWQNKRGKELTRLIRKAENEVLEQVTEEKEFYDDVKAFEKAYTLISPHEEALKYQEDKVFFEAVRDSLKKVESLGDDDYTIEDEEEADSAMKKMVSEEIDVEEMVDIVGIQKDYDRRAVLSQEFMEEMADEQPENVRMKLLKRIVENEIEERKGRNMAKYEAFEEKLDETLNKYHQNFLTTKEVITQLEEYANELREESEREEEDDLTSEERAFYDAISEKGDKEISEDELKEIATELKKRLKNKADIDWTNRRSLKSKMRSEVKSVLRNRGFKPSEYDPLVEPIVKQAEQFYGEEVTA
jgi:DNA-binding transcriptional ArsR family regulator